MTLLFFQAVGLETKELPCTDYGVDALKMTVDLLTGSFKSIDDWYSKLQQATAGIKQHLLEIYVSTAIVSIMCNTECTI